MHRWRGEIDVPLTEAGRNAAVILGAQFESLDGKLSLVYHDWLYRCRDTAKALCPLTGQVHVGCRPWRMGPGFEGHPITPESIRHAQWFAENPHEVPTGGESFNSWYAEWMGWLNGIADLSDGPVGIVTHNRNIQAVYSTVNGKFNPALYNVTGPSFLSVHEYKSRRIAPWNGGELLRQGVYLVRHGETEWGT